MQHNYITDDNDTFKEERYGQKSGARHGKCHIITVLCALVAMADGQIWRERHTEVAPLRTLSPPGFVNSYCPPFKSHLYKSNKHEKHVKPESNVKINIVKEESDNKGLRILTINVTSWSPKIQKMITKWCVGRALLYPIFFESAIQIDAKIDDHIDCLLDRFLNQFLTDFGANLASKINEEFNKNRSENQIKNYMI